MEGAPPCGLFYEDVKTYNKLDDELNCTANWADKSAVDKNGHRLICGESLGAHPHAPQAAVQPLQEPLLLRILEGQRNFAQLAAQNFQLIKGIVAVNKPHASSNTSVRAHHQERFKTDMRSYYQCEDPHNPNVTKCMLLNTFFPTNEVIAAHIIGVKNRNTLAMLDLHPEDLWSWRNGLLLLGPIEKRFDNLEVTFLLNPSTQIFKFCVLYDDILDQPIPIRRKKLGLPGKGQVTFRDINGYPLRLPPLIFPFRRALFYMAYNAFQDALKSRRPHSIAESMTPSDELWEEIRNASASLSECSGSLYFTSFEDVSDVEGKSDV